MANNVMRPYPFEQPIKTGRPFPPPTQPTVKQGVTCGATIILRLFVAVLTCAIIRRVLIIGAYTTDYNVNLRKEMRLPHRTLFHILFIPLLFEGIKAETSVYVLADNLEQIVTSSTLQWMPAARLNETLLENAVIGAYENVEVPNDADVNQKTLAARPVYICRAKANTFWIAGQLRSDKPECIVSIYKNVSTQTQYEVLINIEKSARLSWAEKSKFSLSPQRAVASGGETVRTFVARRETPKNITSPLTHYVGIFDPSENLGIFDLVDYDKMNHRYENGSILVETEPFRYELKNIRYAKYGGRTQKKRVILNEARLANDIAAGTQRVATAIAYNYTHEQYWGKGHGMLTGLPLKIHLPDGKLGEGSWALPLTRHMEEAQRIETYLEEGTGTNVTLIGFEAHLEIPYTATVVAIYKDGERIERVISDTKREHKIIDVVPEFGNVYFLHNNSHVPTTTTTSTTTTSTTTKLTSTSTSTMRSTTTTLKANPIVPPPEFDGKGKKGENDDERKHENNSMQSDSDAWSLPEKNAGDKSGANAGRGRHAEMAFTSIGVMALLLALLT